MFIQIVFQRNQCAIKHKVVNKFHFKHLQFEVHYKYIPWIFEKHNILPGNNPKILFFNGYLDKVQDIFVHDHDVLLKDIFPIIKTQDFLHQEIYNNKKLKLYDNNSIEIYINNEKVFCIKGDFTFINKVDKLEELICISDIKDIDRHINGYLYYFYTECKQMNLFMHCQLYMGNYKCLTL